MFAKLKDLMDSMLETGVPGAAILVKQHGKEIYRYATGYSDRENKIPMTGDERFYIYSCSKVITCTAALQLWEQGKYDLDDELCKYMPEFAELSVYTPDGGTRPAEKKITIRDLFRMTGGLDYWLTCPPLLEAKEKTAGCCPTRETVAYLAKQPLLCDPGAEWHYSLAHDVIAAFVEIISGEKFEDYVQNHVFAPLGIKRSTFIAREADLPTIAPLYNNSPDPETGSARIERFEGGNVYQLGTEYASGGAGCISTMDDYSTFLEGLKDGKLIKPETLKLMTTDQISNEGQRKTH
ncbi:MAG: beta-lactamase family protein, partial [Lentisphaeria bacterium]|nr:beta-lactamase family protein [Lentisphaeria bacterium]